MSEWILDGTGFQGRAFMSLTQNSLITRTNSQGKCIVPSKTHHNSRSGMNLDLDSWSFFLEQEQGKPSSAFFTVEWEWTTHWSVVLKFPSQKSILLPSIVCLRRKTTTKCLGFAVMAARSKLRSLFFVRRCSPLSSKILELTSVTVSAGLTFLFDICAFEWPRGWL